MEFEYNDPAFHVAAAIYAAQAGQFLQNRQDDADKPPVSKEMPPAVKRGVRATRNCSSSRSARIEQLRAQVEAGTYQVDSTELARCMLKHPTDFLKSSE